MYTEYQRSFKREPPEWGRKCFHGNGLCPTVVFFPLQAHAGKCHCCNTTDAAFVSHSWSETCTHLYQIYLIYGWLGGKIYDFFPQWERLRTLGVAINHISVRACVSEDPFAKLKLNQPRKQGRTVISLNSSVLNVFFFFSLIFLNVNACLVVEQ